jgi:hypothetical protein
MSLRLLRDEVGMASKREPAKKSFARAVEQFKQRLLRADRLDNSEIDPETHSAIDQLGSDERMCDVWRIFHGRDELIDRFLDAFFRTAEITANVDRWGGLYAGFLSEHSKIKSAIETLVGFCEANAEVLPERLLCNVKAVLSELKDFSDADMSMLAERIQPILPNSRKSHPAFLLRVHFPRLMVREMLALLGQPHYQAVADTMNVYFDLPESVEVTAAGVRDAWRRHEAGYSSRKTETQ